MPVIRCVSIYPIWVLYELRGIYGLRVRWIPPNFRPKYPGRWRPGAWDLLVLPRLGRWPSSLRMSEPYEETINGEEMLRCAPNPSHELLVDRLHRLVGNNLPANSRLKLLAPRTEIDLGEAGRLQPDLCLVRANGAESGRTAERLYLVAE